MNSMFCRRAFAFLFVAGVLLVHTSVYADTNATVSGLITDPQGRAVTDTTIVLTNVNTGSAYQTKTNGEGIYRLNGLQPGVYRANVSKDGFKSIVKADIELHVQDQLSLNFALQVGSVTETITVEVGVPLINTQDASVSTVVDQTYVKNMPLNGRSFQDLILLTPGVETQTPQTSATQTTGVGITGEFTVNGQRTESNYYMVDGVSANIGAAAGSKMVGGGAGPSGSLSASTALGTTQALVSVDALQEFRVQSSTYSAEYGRSPGGQFAFQTKSGTNQWHGTAYDYLRNSYFDANDWFNNYFDKPGPALRQNDFGGTLGGPVEVPALYHGKDKTFFFVSYEGLRLIAPQPAAINIVPDATLRSTAPAPLSQALNAFPVPNGPEVLVTCDPATDPTCPPTGMKQDGLAQYIGTWSNPASLASTSVRFDHAVGDKSRLFFRFSNTGSSAKTRGTATIFSTPSSDAKLAYTLRTYTAGAASVFSSRLNNDFRLNYSSNAVTDRTVIDAIGGSTPVNLAQLEGVAGTAASQIILLYDGRFVPLSENQQSGVQRQWNLLDTLSLSVGRHQLKFGADYRRLAPIAIPPNPGVLYAYFSESSVQMNAAFTNIQVVGSAYPLYTNFSAFAQDQWTVSPRLNLSLGLRWDVNPAPSVTQGLQGYTLQGSGPDTYVVAPQGTSLWKTTWYNFAPRLGVAYIVHDAPGWETVVRGGGGVFFDTGQQVGTLAFNAGVGFVAQTGFVPTSFPGSPASQEPKIVNPPTPPYAGNIYGYAPHLQLPYTLQWNASIEQELGKPQALTISYVGAHGSRLLKSSAFAPASNPNINFFTFVSNGLTSDYDSLQIQFRRPLSQGLTALGSYTWSHCLDYGSLNYFFGYQRGNCDFDIRHNVSIALSYDLPNIGRNAFTKVVLSHWGIDDRLTMRTGFPVNLLGAFLQEPDGKFYNAGLNFTGKPVYISGAQCNAVYAADFSATLPCPGRVAINPDAFTNVSCPTSNPSCLGDVPRNFTKLLGAWQMNLAVRREFPLYENLKLQFRAEAFNVFNHPNFGSIDPNFGSSTFGQFTGTLAGTLGVLNQLYQTGGPRSMQFALKLVF